MTCRYIIVVPARNEQSNIINLWLELKEELDGLDWQLIVVNDGSTDDTAAAAYALVREDARVRLLSFSRNFGKEAAMLAGLRAAYEAGADAVLLMDADLQHPPEVARHLINRMEETAVDQVVARRNRRGDNWFRTLMARGFYWLINHLTTVELTDGEGDFRVMSRRVVATLLSLPEHQRFSKGLFAWVGFTVEMVEYENTPRKSGKTSWSLRALFNYALSGVIGFSSKPLRLVMYLGLFGVLLSFAYLVWLLVRWGIYGVEVNGYLTTIAMIVFIGSIVMISLGIIGEYLARIFEEVKNRPDYVIERDIHQ